jgi:hypothetical protein
MIDPKVRLALSQIPELDQIFNSDVPVCFIGGPYTKPDPSVNVNNISKWVERLWRSGKVFPICPMVESHLQHLLIPRSYEDWLFRTAQFIRLSNVGFFLWGESSGAERERAIFEVKGIPFFHGPSETESLHQLYDWVENVWKKRDH